MTEMMDCKQNHTDQTNAAEYVETAARGTVADLAKLLALTGDGDEEQAQRLLDEYPLCVEATMTFEVVLGTGGPDTRLCFEVDMVESLMAESGREIGEIRRVFYRYSWEGSAEVELTGEDREIAEAFARRVVPELAE